MFVEISKKDYLDMRVAAQNGEHIEKIASRFSLPVAFVAHCVKKWGYPCKYDSSENIVSSAELEDMEDVDVKFIEEKTSKKGRKPKATKEKPEKKKTAIPSIEELNEKERRKGEIPSIVLVAVDAYIDTLERVINEETADLAALLEWKQGVVDV